MLGKQISTVVGMVLFFACQAQEAKVAPTTLPQQEETTETEIAHPPAIEKTDTAQHLAHYDSLLLNIRNTQTKWSKTYTGANGSEKQELVEKAYRFLFTELTEHIFPAWYNTPWDFNGHTNTPLKGQVACGYFVSTPLKHCGFNINRFKVAQQYSSSIVATLSAEEHITKFGNNNVAGVIEHLSNQPDNIYIVGLDSHVGFLVKKEGKVYFVHSNYFEPVAVECELAAASDCLASSNNFIIGKLLCETSIKKWLLQESFPIKS